MKTTCKQWVAAISLLGVLATPAAAQNVAPASGTRTPVVRKRQLRQQQRIKQGVQSGELTPAETRRLEREQGRIQADKLNAKADGTVTPQERARLQREQNRASRDIYRLKHNERTRK
jgi:CRISPR/Cas system-associated endoribonuclease Cas2